MTFNVKSSKTITFSNQLISIVFVISNSKLLCVACVTVMLFYIGSQSWKLKRKQIHLVINNRYTHIKPLEIFYKTCKYTNFYASFIFNIISIFEFSTRIHSKDEHSEFQSHSEECTMNVLLFSSPLPLKIIKSNTNLHSYLI